MTTLGALILQPATPVLADHRFGPQAGWEKARSEEGRSVLVWAYPPLGVSLGAVIGPWNRLSGWKLFRVVRSADRADVLILPGRRTVAVCAPSYADPYAICVLWAATSSSKTLQHELGHALGLADHIPAAVQGRGDHVRPAVCDEPVHPRHSPYVGVMSYCAWEGTAWFGAGDATMLLRAGYARGGSPPVPPASPTASSGSAWPAGNRNVTPGHAL